MDNEEYNGENLETSNQNKPSLGSRLASGIDKVKEIKDDFKGFKDFNGFNNLPRHTTVNKPGSKPSNGQSSGEQKPNTNFPQGRKQGNGSVLPESVAKKKKSLDNKKPNGREKENSKKSKNNSLAKINEQAFKKGVRTTVDAAVPGAGVAAEKMLDTPVGEPAVEAAKSASNPVSAVEKGTKKLVQIVISSQIKKRILMYGLPTLLALFLIIFVPAILLIKHSDSVAYMGIDASEKYPSGTIISEEYQAFYEAVNSSGVRDKAMLVSVLTAYKENDAYGKNGDYNSDCTDDEIINGTCDTSYDIVSKTSKRKMKKYIKIVTNKINSSSSLDEGTYDNPEGTGSDFFQWLYKDFVEDYYSEYTSKLKVSELGKKKEDIIHYIYLYYDVIKQGNTYGGLSYISANCPNGVTVTGENAGTYDLEEYVAGVVAHENYYFTGSNIEAMKAQAVAVRTFTLNYTNECTKSIPNSTNAQTFYPYDLVNSKYPKAIEAAKETAGQVLTYNGKVFSAQYDGFYGTCSGDICTANYTKIPVESKHTFSVPIKYIPGYARNYFGHGRGMSQYGARWLQDDKGYTYDKILNYFYSTGVELSTNNPNASFNGQTSMPVPVKDPAKWRNYLSRGYQLGTAKCYKNGVYTGKNNCDHLGVDFGSGGITLGTPIYSIADGVVVKVNHSNTGYGNLTMIGHDTNSDGKYDIYSLYAHQYQIMVAEGQTVPAGTQIGKVGSSGNSTGPHLHFEINTCATNEKKCRLIDPSSYLDSIANGNKIT